MTEPRNTASARQPDADRWQTLAEAVARVLARLREERQ